MSDNITLSILGSIETKLKLAADKNFISAIKETADEIIKAMQAGKKVMIAGNGGSAADAQHFAAELAGKFIHQRQGLPAIALTANSSIITAIGNDFGYEYIFSRQLEGLGQAGDVFVGISTSGNSKNLIEALAIAKILGLTTIGLLGNNGGQMKSLCDFNLIVPSSNTQHIQEAHIMVIHSICSLVDNAFKNT